LNADNSTAPVEQEGARFVGRFVSETNVWNGGTWPKADTLSGLTNVHFRRKSGHDVRPSEKNDSVDGGLATMSVIELD